MTAQFQLYILLIVEVWDLEALPHFPRYKQTRFGVLHPPQLRFDWALRVKLCL